jgi:chloramphenicol-sensitive protein RarD
MTGGQARGGAAIALAAYLIWGLLPLYLSFLGHVRPVDLVAHRALWSLALLLLLVLALRRLPAIVASLRGPRVLKTLFVTASLLTFNWLVYVWAVQNGHVVSASLGYFINPLLNVPLAAVFLGERLRPVQGVALALAAAGVLVMLVSGGGIVWLPLALALSFSLYGLLRKLVAIDALGGLVTETALMAVPAILWFALAPATARGASPDAPTLALLVGSGLMTSVPLLLFSVAARRMRYVSISVIQYVAPTVAFLTGIFFYREPLTTSTAITFTLIWAGILLYILDSFRAERGTTGASPRS